MPEGGGFTIPWREKFAPPREVRSVELDRFGGSLELGSFEAPDGYFARASSEVNDPGVDVLKSSSFGLFPRPKLREPLAFRFAVRAFGLAGLACFLRDVLVSGGVTACRDPCAFETLEVPAELHERMCEIV